MLVSTTKAGAGNVAVGKPNFGTGASTVYVAMAGDTNRDGILDDAPNEVHDANHDGRVDEKDLRAPSP